MRPVVKAALCGFAFALAVFVIFSVPQVVKLWLKQAAAGPHDPAAFPVATVLAFASFPAAVAGSLTFVLFWIFFVRLGHDEVPPRDPS